MRWSFCLLIALPAALFALPSRGASTATGAAPSGSIAAEPGAPPSPTPQLETDAAPSSTNSSPDRASKPDSEPPPNAQVNEPKPAAAPRKLDKPEEVTPIAAAKDSLGGHWALAVNLGWAVPFGQLGDGLAQDRAMRTGPGLSLDLAYGVSRTVVVGLWGQGLWFGSVGSCRDCRTTSFGVGPMVRYHVAQGVRFDPWMAAGLGWRTTTVSTQGKDLGYSGPEWIRVMVGGDWYPSRFFGAGPFLELDAGVYGDRPTTLPVASTTAASAGESGWHWAFVMGIRLALDMPGK